MRAGLLRRPGLLCGTMAADCRGNGKFLSGLLVVRMMAFGETGFPLWNKASVTKITTRLLENFCQENLSPPCVSQGQKLGRPPSLTWLFLAGVTVTQQDGSSVGMDWCLGDKLCVCHSGRGRFELYYQPMATLLRVRSRDHVVTRSCLSFRC